MDALEEQKTILSKIRSVVEGLSKNTNNISRLMKDKVEDYILLEEQPLPIRIGDKVIYIGTFTFETEQIFWREWIKILSALQADKLNFDMLSSGGDLYKALKLHNGLYKAICKMLMKTIIKQQGYFYSNGKELKLSWKNCSLRWLMKNLTTEKLIQICLLIHRFNFDAEKKNIQIVLEATGSKEAGEMYIYSWLQNLVGLKGSFANVLPLSTVFASNDTPNSAEATNNGQ